uniref:Uncharacterized protein n=1 Tax=Photinus pyralis TaxID=7054 RepID=A0A1Y1LJ50_PHOPY
MSEWKKVFADWTNNVKKKARNIYLAQLQTGGGLPIPIVLTDLELQLISVLTKIVVTGMPIKELGLTKGLVIRSGLINNQKSTRSRIRMRKLHRTCFHILQKGQLALIKNTTEITNALKNVNIELKRLLNVIFKNKGFTTYYVHDY